MNEFPTAIITTIRHGEKDQAGALTENGTKQALSKGMGIKHLQGDVVLFHSGVARVKDTLTSVTKSLMGENSESEFSEYSSHYLHYLYDPAIKSEYFSNWEKLNGIKELEQQRMQDFLKLHKTSTEPEIYPSPYLMAVRMARVIATQIDFATITEPEIRTNFINGSHEPVIASFLNYFLQDYNLTDPNFIERMGGTINFCEGFEIEVYQTRKDENKVILKFRDFEKEVDQNKLKQFAIGI